MGAYAIQLFVMLGAPAFALWLVKRSKVAETLSQVAICYAIGIVYGNLPFAPVAREISENGAGAAIILALPLLLFSVDVPAWARSARVTLTASLICFVSVGTVALTAGYYFAPSLEPAPHIAAALSAVYTGGTPSMFAIASAINIAPPILVMTNLSDMLIGGPYFFFLIAYGYRIYGWLLPAPDRSKHAATVRNPEQIAPTLPGRSIFTSIALATATAAAAVGLSMLMPKDSRDVATIIMVSTLAIALSFSKKIRELPSHYAVGEYILLVFCVSVGSMAKLSEIQAADPRIFALVATIFFGSTVLELILFRLFKVDRDTAVMAAVGSTYSPAFVGPVASRLNNPDAFFSGVTIGLMGYAIATYLGLGVNWTLMTWLR